MSPKNDTKVLIGGNVYTLSGNESEEYIQRVALYINNKMEEVRRSDNGKTLNTRLQSVLLAINIADDLFKSKETINQFEAKLKAQEEKADALNQNIVALEKKLSDVENEKEAVSSKIERLERELSQYKRELDEYIEIFDQNDTE